MNKLINRNGRDVKTESASLPQCPRCRAVLSAYAGNGITILSCTASAGAHDAVPRNYSGSNDVPEPHFVAVQLERAARGAR